MPTNSTLWTQKRAYAAGEASFPGRFYVLCAVNTAWRQEQRSIYGQ